MRSHIPPIVIHETPSDVSRWRFIVEFQKKYFMENIMRDITETNPVIPPVMHGRSLDYAAEIERFQSEIIKYLSSETIVTILKNLESDDAIKI